MSGNSGLRLASSIPLHNGFTFGTDISKPPSFYPAFTATALMPLLCSSAFHNPNESEEKNFLFSHTRHKDVSHDIFFSFFVLRGKPRIKGTRIPVSLILGYLAAGRTIEEIIKELPDLTKEQIAICLDYARDLSEFEVSV